jgi:general secretion pathway protein L
MSKFVGIDIRPNLVRVTVLRSSYRRIEVEALREIETRGFDELEHAVRHAAGEFTRHGEAVAVTLGGQTAFIHRLALPPAALKQVEEVVPFELEARVPVDFDTLVYDSRVLPRQKHDALVEVLAAAVPSEQVKDRIDLVRDALGHEPEQVSLAPLTLSNLAVVTRELRSEECVAVVELADSTCEVVLVHQGVAVFGRTLSIGVSGFPASAPELARTLRQTWVSWAATATPQVTKVYLCGGGADTEGICDYLTQNTGVEVALLPEPEFGLALTADQRAVWRRYARSMGVALSLRSGSKDLNLRKGALAYQRGYGFLKERLPLLSALGGALLLSFLFSAWAENRALSQEKESLGAALGQLSKQILEEESTDANYVQELLDKGLHREKDPQPEIDAFQLALMLSKHIPLDLEHEIDELDLARNHVKLRGIAKSTEAAQKIAENLKTEPCFKDVAISKISQFRNTTRQNYSMEFEIRCEEVATKKRPAGAPEEQEP